MDDYLLYKYNIINIINKHKKNIIIQIIIDIIFSILTTIVFIYFSNKLNQGEIRSFLTLGYCLGFLLEKISLGKLFAKGYKKLYNLVNKISKKFKKSKLGRIILK
jgi:hypothetical protein